MRNAFASSSPKPRLNSDVRFRCLSSTAASFLEAGFRADIVVAHELILEIKSVEALVPMHEAQLLTYLRMSGIGSDC